MAAKKKKDSTVAYRSRVTLLPGDVIRITRGLQEMTQAELAEASGLAPNTISSIENGRVTLGVDRAERIARALKVHPAVLLWPHWGEEPAKRTG